MRNNGADKDIRYTAGSSEVSSKLWEVGGCWKDTDSDGRWQYLCLKSYELFFGTWRGCIWYVLVFSWSILNVDSRCCLSLVRHFQELGALMTSWSWEYRECRPSINVGILYSRFRIFGFFPHKFKNTGWPWCDATKNDPQTLLLVYLLPVPQWRQCQWCHDTLM